MSSLSTDQEEFKEAILVVDDEVGPRESLRMILKPLYEVHTASGGQEALALIRKKEFAVVTLDLKMPGLSGIDVLKEIKKFGPSTEVIVVTGYGTLNNAQEAIRFGAGDFISKPFNIADIISVVGKSFERRRFNLKIKSLVERIQTLRSTVNNVHENDQTHSRNRMEGDLSPKSLEKLTNR